MKTRFKVFLAVGLLVLLTIVSVGGFVLAQDGALIGAEDRSGQEYVWISQFSSLPLFVERVYPALDAFARDFGVTVRRSGPTNIDLAAYIATVEQECAQNPAGVIVVGGWDQALTEPVNRCIEMRVPVIVTDGDLFEADRLAYVGTNWYNLGVTMAEFQLAEHERRGLASGQVAIVAPITSETFQRAVQGFTDTVAGTSIELVAVEDNQSSADITAQRASALIAAYPELTGLVGMDSEGGPGIVAALNETGKAGQLVVTTNEAGAEYLQNLVDGTVQLVVMEKYDVMNYLALFMLYSFHNDAIRTAGIDPWESNWMPDSIDSGLLQVTQENVEQVMSFMMESAGS